MLRTRVTRSGQGARVPTRTDTRGRAVCARPCTRPRIPLEHDQDAVNCLLYIHTHLIIGDPLVSTYLITLT